jgi:oligopeptide transport system ATP-binding protein
VSLPTNAGPIRVVTGLDLDVAPGQVSGIAGESGSGKTISMMAILGLLPAGSTVHGQARFRGYDLLTLSDKELAKHRGKDIGLVMQDPHSSLHPMLSIGSQLTDHLRYHLRISQHEAQGRALELLRQVRIPDPKGSFNGYPHQFSGGMCQRVAIATALACGPSLLIADEPTTGLDVTVQAGIIHLLHDLAQRLDLAIILITHDIGVISTLADTVTIMYAGRVMETGPTSGVISAPRHPYTAALLEALPHPDKPEAPLVPIPGSLGAPDKWPSGCAFHPRCQYATSRCSQVIPNLIGVDLGRRHSCLVDPFGPRL